MNKCKNCGRPLTKNKLYCSHCKTKIGNKAGKIGAILAPILSVALVVGKKFKK